MANLFLSHSATEVVSAWKSNCISVLHCAPNDGPETSLPLTRRQHPAHEMQPPQHDVHGGRKHVCCCSWPILILKSWRELGYWT